jgi:hypothetical protein
MPMATYLTFKDIKNKVEANYPQPIAQAFRRYRVASHADLGGRHKMLIDLFELFMKFLCIVELQEGLQSNRNFRDRLPQKDKSLEFLRRPTLGGWVGLLRTLSQMEEVQTVSLPWTKTISDWFLRGNDEQSIGVLSLLDELVVDRKSGKNKSHHAEMINELVSYRNKKLAHGVHSEGSEIERRLLLLEKVIAHLLDSARFLEKMSLIFTEGISIAEGNRWKIEAKELRGLTEEPVIFVREAQLNFNELYLCETPGQNEQTSPISFGPFAVWQMNDGSKQREMFFFNSTGRTNLEYLSYSSGSYYYHKELREEFRSLLHIEIAEGMEEGGFESLPPEQRAERAEYYYKHGVHLAAQGRLEDAVCQLEQSAMYERRPRTFLDMAGLQKKLNDPVDAIVHSIQNCLDIEPDNAEAISMMAEIESSDHSVPGVAPESALGAIDHFECPMFVDAFTPRRFRDLGWLWWAALMIFYYTASGILEFLYGDKIFVASVAGMLVCTLVFTSGLTLARPLFLWLLNPLSLQLGNMRMDRFRPWFRDEAKKIFGDLRFRDGRFCFRQSIKAEPAFWWGAVGWLLSIGGLILVGTDSFNQPFLILCKRLIDFFFILIWLYPCVRYIVRTTAFIYHYSQLPLKPMLTKINDEGMRSLGALMAFNIGLACLAFVSYFLPASFTHRGRIYSDIVVLMAITAIVFIWSIGMPLMVKRAARRAKYSAVMAYSGHIETAFKDFLDNPTEESLKAYRWLVSNQTVIQRIGVWPLSFRQTLFLVVGSNFLLIALCVHYVLMRFNLWKYFLSP